MEQEMTSSPAFLAAALFALGACVGAFLAFCHFTGRERKLPVALLHGLFVASGILCLVVGYFTNRLSGMASVALVVFLVVAVGGFYLFFRHLRKEPLPTHIVIMHGAGAVIGFLILLFSIFA